MAVWHTRFACWMSKSTYTHSECVILLFHSNSGNTNVPQWYVIRNVASFAVVCTFWLVQQCHCKNLLTLVSCYWSLLRSFSILLLHPLILLCVSILCVIVIHFLLFFFTYSYLLRIFPPSWFSRSEWLPPLCYSRAVCAVPSGFSYALQTTRTYFRHR
jgi:hypothetical protein